MIANKEIEWTQQYEKSIELDFPHNGFFQGKKSPEDYLSLLIKYLALVPYHLPECAKRSLNKPTLRHLDMSAQLALEIGPDTVWT